MESKDIRKVIRETPSISDIIDNISGYKGYMINPLGSCQYTTIYGTYSTLCSIYDMLKEEKGHPIETREQEIELIRETFGLVGLQISKLEINFNKFDDSIENLKKEIYKNYEFDDFNENDYIASKEKEDIEEDEDDDDKEEDDEDISDSYEFKACVEAYEKVKSFDDYLTYCCSSSWDLWGTIPLLVENVFKEIEIVGTPEKEGKSGFIMNDIMQKQNYKLGMYMFIMLKLGIVKNFDSFANFDT